MTENVAALVVSYHPDDLIIRKLLRSLSAQVDHLILIDNGGGESVAKALMAEGLPLNYISLGNNLGLGHALNIGFERAESFGVKYVATFDQDSDPTVDLIKRLKQAHSYFEENDANCAAVGPVFFDRRESNKVYFPFYYEKNGRISAVTPQSYSGDYICSDALITSGMLVRLEVWSKGVRYDEGLFVDYTDTEWSFRVRNAGYKLYGCLRVEMGHAPSDAPPARFFGLSFFRYSPLRRYYYFRNTVRFCLQPYVTFAWKRRLAIGLTLRLMINSLIDKNKTKSICMMIKGVHDGFRGISGQF